MLFLFILNWIGFGIYDHLDNQADDPKHYTVWEHLFLILICIIMAPYTFVMQVVYLVKKANK